MNRHPRGYFWGVIYARHAGRTFRLNPVSAATTLLLGAGWRGEHEIQGGKKDRIITANVTVTTREEGLIRALELLVVEERL